MRRIVTGTGRSDLQIAIIATIIVVPNDIGGLVNTVSTMKVRQELGDILNRVSLRHDEFIVERKGRQLAAIVPVDTLLAMRKAASTRILKVMEDNARYGVDSETADKIANEAKHRSRKRG